MGMIASAKVWVWLLCLLPLTVMGQQAKPKVKTLAVRVACFGVIEPFSQIVLPGHVGNIQLSERYPTDLLKVKIIEGKPLKIYARDTEVIGKSSPIGKVAIPPQANGGMILLYPSQNKYQGLFIDSSDFPSGSVYIRNFTSSKIGIEFEGGRKVRIPSRRSFIYKGSAGSTKSVKVKMSRLDEDKKWKLFSSSSWRLHSSRKEMLILFQLPESKKIRIKGITQFENQSGLSNQAK